MNERDHNFQDVKRLLKLKRHEVPPPGYFNNFSSQVVARIRAGEASESQTFAENLQERAPWLVSFIRMFEAKPGLIGGMATSLCLLLVFGLVLTNQSDSTTIAGGLMSANSQPAGSGDPSAPVAMADPLMASASTGITLSTNPVTSLQPMATVFGGGSSLFQPVNLSAVSH